MATQMPSSLEIAQEAELRPIARDRGGRSASSRTSTTCTASTRRRSASPSSSGSSDAARREAHLRHGDHADEGRRGQDDDLGLADPGARAHRQEAGALPARGLARPGLRDQGRRGRRRLRAGRPDGGPQPPLHGRHPRDRRGEQPARRDARGAPAARQQARDRPADGELAALRRHQRPRAARRSSSASAGARTATCARRASTSPPRPR